VLIQPYSVDGSWWAFFGTADVDPVISFVVAAILFLLFFSAYLVGHLKKIGGRRSESLTKRT